MAALNGVTVMNGAATLPPAPVVDGAVGMCNGGRMDLHGHAEDAITSLWRGDLGVNYDHHSALTTSGIHASCGGSGFEERLTSDVHASCGGSGFDERLTSDVRASCGGSGFEERLNNDVHDSCGGSGFERKRANTLNSDSSGHVRPPSELSDHTHPNRPQDIGSTWGRASVGHKLGSPSSDLWPLCEEGGGDSDGLSVGSRQSMCVSTTPTYRVSVYSLQSAFDFLDDQGNTVLLV